MLERTGLARQLQGMECGIRFTRPDTNCSGRPWLKSTSRVEPLMAANLAVFGLLSSCRRAYSGIKILALSEKAKILHMSELFGAIRNHSVVQLSFSFFTICAETCRISTRISWPEVWGSGVIGKGELR